MSSYFELTSDASTHQKGKLCWQTSRPPIKTNLLWWGLILLLCLTLTGLWSLKALGSYIYESWG